MNDGADRDPAASLPGPRGAGMPARMVHRFQHRASAGWGRVRAVLKPSPPPPPFPIPLALPIELQLAIFEQLPPESIVALVCCCSYMHGLYSDDGSFATEQLWGPLLRRTFPSRLTGAPGPNAPPRLKRAPRLVVSAFGNQWVDYLKQLRAVRTRRRRAREPREAGRPRPPRATPAGWEGRAARARGCGAPRRRWAW